MAMLLATAIKAQGTDGDLKRSGRVEVSDITRLINNYLTGASETSDRKFPLAAEKNGIAGTWWRSSTESLTFNDDGTTDYADGYTYELLPEGYILLYNKNGTLVSLEHIIQQTADSLVLTCIGSTTPVGYSVNRPIGITLSKTSLDLQPDDYTRISATMVPSDAGAVTWTSSDEKVATVLGGIILGIADGTATITASVGGASATCIVNVTSITYNNNHEYVDLGLSVKWATMNIGADSPEEYGSYFAWGETSEKKVYNWSTYKYGTSATHQTKYNEADGKVVLDPIDDVARANWGGTWRMPTYDEMMELKEKCFWSWTTLNGVRGRKVTGPSGNSIFLPAAGYYHDNELTYARNTGGYWTSSISTSNSTLGWNLYFYPNTIYMSSCNRCDGWSVRAVCP